MPTGQEQVKDDAPASAAQAAEALASPETVGSPGSARPQGWLEGLGQMIPPTGPVGLSLRGLSRAFVALQHREYRLLWIGALLSNIGSWIETVARQWLVYDLGGSKKWLGIDAFASGAATLVFLPLGGVLADHLDRRWLLAGGNIVLGLLSLAFAVLYACGVLHVGHLIAGSVVMGICMAMLVPANQSLLPQLVPREDLGGAVALSAMQFNLSRAIGPAIGGATLVVLGAAWSFGLNAASFLTIIVAALMIAAPARAAAGRAGGLLSSLAGGASYLRTRPDLLMIQAMVLSASFCGAPMMALLPAFVKDIYAGGAAGYSMLLSCFGVGAVVGAGVAAGRSRGRPSPWRAFPVLMAFGLAEAALGLAGVVSYGPFHVPFEVTLVLTMICGACFVGSLNRIMAAILASTPDAMRGRVSSYHMICWMLGMPVGALAGSYLADWKGLGAAAVRSASPSGFTLQMHGIGFVFLLYGLLMAAAGITLLRLLRRWDVKYHVDGHLGGPAEGI